MDATIEVLRKRQVKSTGPGWANLARQMQGAYFFAPAHFKAEEDPFLLPLFVS
jgi:hypothetical protein